MHRKLSELLAHKGHDVYSIAPQTTVLEAVHEMNKRHIGVLLVIEGGVPVGIFSERDVLRRVLDGGRDPQSTAVGDVMTKDLVTVSSSTSVGNAMAIMTEKRIRHLPIVDGDKLKGMISIGDLTRIVSFDRKHEIEELINYITGKYPG